MNPDRLPVVFRFDRGEVTAVFPTLPANPGFMVCYAHIGQHSECSRDWYYTTRPATEAERASLLAELRQIYDDCELIVQRRLPPWRTCHAFTA